MGGAVHIGWDRHGRGGTMHTALADTRSSGRRNDALGNPELLRREGEEKAARRRQIYIIINICVRAAYN